MKNIIVAVTAIIMLLSPIIPAISADAAGTSYKVKVKRGETLSLIAKKNCIPLKTLLKANKSIKKHNKIKVGQKITIPANKCKKRVVKPKPTPPVTSPVTPSVTPTEPAIPAKPATGEAVDTMTKTNITAQDKVDFIASVKDGAIQGWTEQDKKILPSLTIAQAILEGGWGFSYLSVNGNNFFGVKSGSTWTGETIVMKTWEFDRVQWQWEIESATFRKYDSKTASITNHNVFLTAPRYASVWNQTDYKVATQNVWQSGYATDPKYPQLLQNIIQTYNLTQYDVEAGVIQQ